MKQSRRRTDPLTHILATYRDPNATDFAHAWAGLEPTFQTRKSVRLWKKLGDDEDAYLSHRYMVKTEKKIAKAIRKEYEAQWEAGLPHCLFARVELDKDHNAVGAPRRKLRFYWADEELEPLEVGLAADPESFEYGIKPVPLAWFYDDRFVGFLEAFIWGVPLKLGLSCAIGHGGGQFHLSAKTFLTGSLLADDIATRLNHPELASWIMDYPQPDDRSFRATRERKAAFESVLRDYWAGKFHPRAIGALTPENAYLDRGFGPACAAHPELMDQRRGPAGDARDVFQTNFAFGRVVRWQAQNIHPGYWQSAHPKEDGYRPDQIMRYSEGNLNRLEICGELHVKSDKVLEPERVPEFDAPLDRHMLVTEAAWESRAHLTRTSARDFVEAMLLDVHHAQYLQAHPHVELKETLLQDQLLGGAEDTLRRYAPKQLEQLKREARPYNLEESHGRMKSDWVEPECLFWAAWRALPAGEKAAIAQEAIAAFVERVEHASSMDKRPKVDADPMEWHRHRIHPELWKALASAPDLPCPAEVRRELKAWQAKQEHYLARRPVWSQDETNLPPWERD
jgi:hypothetical protein